MADKLSNSKPSNLKGITTLLNKQYIKDGIDLNKAEEEVIGNIKQKEEINVDMIKNYCNDIDELLRKVGMGDDTHSHSSKSSKTHSSKSSKSLKSSHHSRSHATRSESDSGSERSERSSKSSYSSHSSRSESNSHSKKKIHNQSHRTLDAIREEESEVTKSINYHELGRKKEKALAQIKRLITSIENDGMDCSEIIIPNSDSDIEDIENVLQRLKIINDSSQCTTIAEEILMGAANALEYVFDGEVALPGTNIKPNYTGYSRTLQVKLQNMKYDTSEIVNEFVERNNVGSIGKLFFALAPGFLMYPKVNNSSKTSTSILKDPRLNDASDARLEISGDAARRNYNALKKL